MTTEARWALLARAIQGLGALLAVVAVVRGYDVEIQGLFFTFLSLAALIQLGDFGVGYASLQMAGHLRARGDATAATQLRRQARQRSFAWLGGACVLTAALVAAWLPASRSVAWLGPWCALASVAAVFQGTQVELAWLEGAHSVGRVWRLRFVQEALGACALVGGLLAGAGLWSLSLYFGIRAVVALLWMVAKRGAASAPVVGAGFSWSQQLWPFQWRIGLSALAGFLVFQALNPLLLLVQNAQAAARFGLALAAMNMLLLLSTAWPLSQAARFAALLTGGSRDGVRQRFSQMLWPSLGLAFAAALLALALMAGLLQYRPALAPRLPDLATLALLLAAGLAHHATACHAVVLRAERLEPLLHVSVIGGFVSLALTAAVAHMAALPAIAATHLGCTIAGLWIARRHYERLLRRLPASSP